MAPRRILIVDDSAIVRHTVAHMLRRLGFIPVEATDGEKALVEIRRSPPDAVILDIHMPVKNGLTTLAEIRATPRFANLPVFILTTSAGGDHVRRAASLRVNGYLVKAELNYCDLGQRLGAVLENTTAPPASRSEELLDGLQVLLAHGEEGHPRGLVALLADWGCKIIPSDSASEICELLRGGSIDVVLVEKTLADKEGFDLAAALPSPDGGGQIPVILLTPSPSEDASSRDDQLGVVARVAEPVKPAELLAALQALTTRTRAGGDTLFDRDEFLDRAGGEIPLARHMAGLFLRDTPGILADLRQGAQGKDAQAIAANAHTLVGMLGTLGAHGVAALAGEMEGMARQGKVDVEPSLASLSETIDRLSEIVKTEFNI